MRLIILFKSDSRGLEYTWSGTSYSLLHSLSKNNDVLYLNNQDSLLCSFFKKICRLFAKSKFTRKTSILISRLVKKMESNKAKKLVKPYPNVAILEIADDVLIPKRKVSIYQDLSLVAVNKFRHTPVYGGGLHKGEQQSFFEHELTEQNKFYEKCEHIFFMGKWVCNETINQMPNLQQKIKWVGGGVHENILVPLNELSFEAKENIVLFIGVDFYRKGGPLVLNAFRLFENEHPEFKAKLVIAGCDIQINEPNIDCIGFAQHEQILDLLKKAKVLCVPSNFEAYGLVFPEAICNGVICVGQKKFEMPEFITKDYGYLLDENNPIMLSKIIFQALSNEKMIRKLINDAKKNREYYSWDNVAKKIIDSMENFHD